MTLVSVFPKQHYKLLPNISFMVYTKLRGHYLAWVKEMSGESKLIYASMSWVEVPT